MVYIPITSRVSGPFISLALCPRATLSLSSQGLYCLPLNHALLEVLLHIPRDVGLCEAEAKC